MTTDTLLVIFNGSLAALLSYLGLFVRFQDRWTPLLMAYLGSGLWFIMGMSAFDIRLGAATSGGEPVITYVIIGFGIGALVFLFATHDLLFGSVEEIDERATGEHLLK